MLICASVCLAGRPCLRRLAKPCSGLRATRSCERESMNCRSQRLFECMKFRLRRLPCQQRRPHMHLPMAAAAGARHSQPDPGAALAVPTCSAPQRPLRSDGCTPAACGAGPDHLRPPWAAYLPALRGSNLSSCDQDSAALRVACPTCRHRMLHRQEWQRDHYDNPS